MGIRTRLRDAVDAIYMPVMGRTGLPPYSLRSHVGPVDEYERTPAEYLAYFRLLGGLRMDERVLDIGCGTGRFAAELLGRPHFFTGRYEGFDIDDRAVRWATDHVTRRHPNARFAHVDLYSSHYRPDSTARPETFTFPYDAGAFDFAFAVSVFTHLPRSACERYLQETARVLGPGGRALFTFLLLPEPVDTLTPIALERGDNEILERKGLVDRRDPGRLHRLDGGCWTLTPAAPEIVILYEEAALEELARRAGLSVDAVHYGSWSREQGGPAFQDLVLLSHAEVPGRSPGAEARSPGA